jgi:hypothetical protein
MPWAARMRASMAMKGSRGTKPIFPPTNMGSPVGPAMAALVSGKGSLVSGEGLYHGLF